MNRILLKNHPHIKEYNKIRMIHNEIIDNMASYYDSGKFSLKFKSDPEHMKDNIGSNAKPLDISALSYSFDINSDTDSTTYYDMAIYKCAPNATSITEEYLTKHRFKNPEKIEMLEAMQNSYLGLFEITSADMQTAYVNLRDVFTGKEFTIIDTGLCMQMTFDEYLYLRVITYREVSFVTGLVFIFLKKDSFIKTFIKNEKKDFDPTDEFSRYIKLYNRYSKYAEVDVMRREY